MNNDQCMEQGMLIVEYSQIPRRREIKHEPKLETSHTHSRKNLI
jgi:hypothetical protein